MTLKTCVECGKQVSDTAKTCPNCGVKEPTKMKETLIIRIATKFFGWVCIGIILSIAWVIYGYYSGEKENRKIEMQKEVRNWINDSKDIKECKLICKTVELIKESQNKYTGYAKFNNDDQAHVDVTVEGDEYLMKADLGSVIARKALSEYEEQQRILSESVLMCGVVIQQFPEINTVFTGILNSIPACNIPEDEIQKSALIETLVSCALVNDIVSDKMEVCYISFPEGSEELQKAEGEYLFVTVIKDGQHDLFKENGEKITINKYRLLESK